LALHELGANAVKHGALSIDSGHVDVQWRWAESAGFELTWTEHGGPVVEPPTRRGFGSTLLERVTGKELGGGATLEFNSEGLRATFRGNAAAVAEGPAERLAPSLPQIAVADTAASAIPTGEASGSDISGARVLIVEDSVLLALELESGLVESGALVVGVAADLDEALGLLSLNFDVAVLDVNLNGRLVTPVADALATRGTPFIFATGRGDPSVGPAHAAAPVVRKPYNVHQIAGALAAAMSKSRHR
jgi:CheY-like chemotaxis protein